MYIVMWLTCKAAETSEDYREICGDWFNVLSTTYFEFFRPASALFPAIAIILGLEVRRFNRELSSQGLDVFENQSVHLESFRLRHGMLCLLFEDAYVFLCNFLFSVYVFGIPFILLFVLVCAEFIDVLVLAWTMLSVVKLVSAGGRLPAWSLDQLSGKNFTIQAQLPPSERKRLRSSWALAFLPFSFFCHVRGTKSYQEP